LQGNAKALEFIKPHLPAFAKPRTNVSGGENGEIDNEDASLAPASSDESPLTTCPSTNTSAIPLEQDTSMPTDQNHAGTLVTKRTTRSKTKPATEIPDSTETDYEVERIVDFKYDEKVRTWILKIH
jgi:hypothetical protein